MPFVTLCLCWILWFRDPCIYDFVTLVVTLVMLSSPCSPSKENKKQFLYYKHLLNKKDYFFATAGTILRFRHRSYHVTNTLLQTQFRFQSLCHLHHHFVVCWLSSTYVYQLLRSVGR